MVAPDVPAAHPSAYHAAAPISLCDALLLSCELDDQDDVQGAIQVLREANPPPATISPNDSIPPEN